MSHTTVKSLNAEIKLLEARKKLVEKRDGEVPKALSILRKYADVLTPAQRRDVAKLIGSAAEVKGQGSPKPSEGPLKGRKLGKVAPKYRLPTGETWTGRGLAPKVFTSWSKSAEGKAWNAANPDQRFPGVGAGRVAKKAVTKLKTVAKKVATRVVGKAPAKRAPSKKAPARKNVKKVVPKSVKKTTAA